MKFKVIKCIPGKPGKSNRCTTKWSTFYFVSSLQRLLWSSCQVVCEFFDINRSQFYVTLLWMHFLEITSSVMEQGLKPIPWVPEVYTLPIQTACRGLAKRVDSMKRTKWVTSLTSFALCRPLVCHPSAGRLDGERVDLWHPGYQFNRTSRKQIFFCISIKMLAMN